MTQLLLMNLFILLFSFSALAQKQQTGNAVASGFSGVAKWVNDRQVRDVIQKEINELEKKIREQLEKHSKQGVLLEALIYKHAEGQKVLHAVRNHGTGKTPEEAYCKGLENPVVRAAPPKGLLLDEETSFFLWFRNENGNIKREEIKAPFYKTLKARAQRSAN